MQINWNVFFVSGGIWKVGKYYKIIDRPYMEPIKTFEEFRRSAFQYYSVCLSLSLILRTKYTPEKCNE